ncbi:SDR family NAD(P)-dependent oxidoreductase [Streptomyces sp. Rer75]|uniref:SDR family NAD(P)-dependent oxidoreductase n=1 Tax=Streptomyces sp. Rer75 TaxID=2750011 RepID=UPI0015D07EE7|nr:SDR family NAD(P)-dependent oxidoreductase [Streptomyces sp. Rer75]QLH25416.1 SDR family NAD(P)-dependent oxidoreductase [Streptomyces sp. Rer75]
MSDSPTFAATFTVTAENPLLKGHVVHGRSLLPGVGYVDLVLQVLARHGHAMRDIELRNLTILAPLVAAPGEEVLTTVEGRPAPAGGWRIEVRSRRPQDRADVLHARATAHRHTAPAFQKRLPLPLTGHHRATTLNDIYTWLRQQDLVHSGLMKSEGVVHHRPDDWVVELELAAGHRPQHRDGADGFLFHPALFEAGLLGGSVGSHMLYEGDADEGLYLPLVFESFRADAPLGSRCYVRVPAASTHRDDELMRLAVEFYDETGAKVAEVGRLSAKRVRDFSALDVREGPVLHTAVSAPPAGDPVAVAVAAGPDVAATLRELIAVRLDVPAAQVDVESGFYELGLASADLVSLVPDLEDRLSLSLSPTLMFEYPSVVEVAAWLEGQTAGVPDGSGSADSPSVTRAALTDEISALLGVPAEEVDPDAAFEEFGFDLTGLARLVDRLNDRYGLALTPAVFAERPTVRAVAAYLAEARGGTTAVAADTRPAPDPETRARPHPMLHRVERDGEGAVCHARFEGDESFLRDHQIRGARVLPGVAQLEMARAAVASVLVDGAEQGRVRLTDVVWLRPAVCGPEGLELRVDVRTLPGHGWEYTIHQVGADGELTLCGQGRADLSDTGYRSLPSLDELRAACTERTLASADIYGIYARVGMDYGPAQRSLATLGVGTDGAGRPQALVELRLPVAADPLDGYRLHPGIVDGALQAVIGLRLAEERFSGSSARPALPFALQRAEASAPTPGTAYAWIRHQPGSGPKDTSPRLDITVFDERGRVCADLAGLSTRTLTDAPANASVDAPADAYPSTPSAHAATDIAIVGVSGRYPEAADLDEFWRNLRSGRDCIREVPAERWDHRRHADVGGSSSGRWGGFLQEIDRFDPLFFQISLHEAELLDPQERLFLQCAHHTLEDAGYAGELPGRVGVFVGVMYQEYQLYGAQAQDRGVPAALSGSASTVANRVSYFYDFTGPSMTVDTMCSSSLTAIHLACEAIRSGQCDTALAGGVNLHSHPNKFLMLSQRRFLSSDGRCRSFGEGGDGYVPGEGVGAVLLKPLERAVADGDQIHGVIKGTALNHGGRTSGYSVPSPAAQGEVITEALAAAGVDPRSLGYLEAHGTGTSLGDPIEIAGLTKAFHAPGGLPTDLPIGSVKSNIGHCEGAAGIAGVTKVLLQMRHGELVPSLHSGVLNPHIDLTGTPLSVQQRAEPWRRPVLEGDGGHRTHPRTAGVSGFGAGGSNAHVVIAEYEPPTPPPARSDAPRRPALLVLSAQSQVQLVEQARRLHARLAELTDDDLPDVAWTLQVGRMALEERLAFAATSIEAARARLESFAADPGHPRSWVRGTAPRGRGRTAGADGDALRSALAEWTAHGTPDRLLGMWAEGAAVAWDTLYPSLPPARRISLPGYPFARERCWFDLDLAAGTRVTTEPRQTATGQDATGQGSTKQNTTGPDEMVLLRPEWVERNSRPAEDTFAEHHVLVIGHLTADDRDALRTALPAAACHFLELADGSLDRQYAQAAEGVFTLAHGILDGRVRRPVLLQVALVGAAATDAERDRLACFGGLAGLLKTAHQENPLLHTGYVECLDAPTPATVATRLAGEAVRDPEPEVRHRDGHRLVATLAPIAAPRAQAQPWKQDGVYLITGGAGGLGRIVAKEIAASAGRATVVLTGRSPLSAQARASLNELRTAGLTVDYQRTDVTDRASVERVLAHVADNHGPLTGIVHSAGVIDDGFLLRKSPERLARVLAPKVAGLVNLDELSRDQPLEVFLCFSSTAGAFGNPGQADYAAGNAFMDAYAAYRNRLVGAGLCTGSTVSVNWPLWEEGGMDGDAVRESLRDAGLAPLDTPRGLEALRCAMDPRDNGLADGRLLVLVGRRDELLSRLPGNAPEPAVPEPAAAVPPEAPNDEADRALEDRAVGHLRRLLASSLKLGPERIAVDTPLERYGMDSVIAVNVISRLEEDFGPLSRTLLFESETVRELARYFVADHTQTLRTLLGVPTPPPAPPVQDTTTARQVVTASPTPPHRTDTGDETEPRSGRADVHDRGEDIAVIGITGRYPGAEDLDTLWTNLRDGKDAVTAVPPGRWNHESADGTGEEPGPWGGFLDGIDRFDPLLFGISPREAAAMDPQQRLFLETVWHLLEQSGVTQSVIERRYERRVGVYVGAAYQLYRADASDPALAAVTSAASYNMIANRVSHFFGLEGPSLAVDTMCASSATAIHLACADLRRGESELAVAGGINLTVHPDKYIALAELQLLGSHPGSRSFRDGDGYLPAEAVGAVLLKPLAAAVRDGDRVHAVIKGTSSLHGGRSNGFMRPSHRAQVKVMRRALEQAGAGPDSIGYVEAAANGTTISDEIEFQALREVFDGVTEPVALGTVKSNLGHPEAASGIAQLTKVILQLRHQELPPLVAAGSPNPHLDADGTALRLCDRLTPWEPRGAAGPDGRPAPRRALINSVAAGGSHVSLVVEAPPPTGAAAPEPDDPAPQLVVVSAATPERLRTAVRRLHAYLEGDGPASLADIAYTSQLGREAQAERFAVVAGSLDELRQALAQQSAGPPGAGDMLADDAAPAVPVHRGNAEEDAGPLGTVLSGARGEAFLAGLVADGDLDHLAELWVRGIDVPWDGLHRGARRLAPLPLTEFERDRHWAGRAAGALAIPETAATAATDAVTDTDAVTGRAEPPRDRTLTEAERTMAAAWSELLMIDVDRLGARSNFLSLGGNSLLATRLINLLAQRTGVELPVKVVFDAPGLAEMAAELERRTPSGNTAAPDTEQILRSIALIERMSDEELDALDIAN